MTRRALIAAAAVLLACGWNVRPAEAAQTSLADAQRDYNAGRYNRAVDALTSAIAKSPNEAPLYFLLGQNYYQLREYQRAVTSLERAVQLVPKNSDYQDWLGKAYGRRAEESMLFSAMSFARKTHRQFEIAVELDPQNMEAQRDLIRFEMNAPGAVGGGDDKALRHIEALAKLDATQGQLARGEFFATKKRVAEAEGVFSKILETGSDRAGVYFEVCDFYRDHPNADKMAEAVHKAEAIAPDDRRLKFYKGVLLVVQGKNAGEAEILLKSYITTVPDNSDFPPHSIAYEWLGKLYESLGRSSEAAEQYRQALSLDPHNKQIEEELKRLQRK